MRSRLLGTRLRGADRQALVDASADLGKPVVPSGGQNGIRAEGLTATAAARSSAPDDDTPPYRAFLDPAKFRRKEKVQLVAVERALDGSTSVSSVGAFAFR